MVSSFFSTVTNLSSGIDFKIKQIGVDNQQVKLQVWDTAGQERFRTITQTYYKGAMGIILVYDVTDETTFNNIRNWIKQIETHAAKDVCKVLVGNKCDLEEDRVVSTEQGQQLADEYGLPFFEASAKARINVNELFFDIAKRIVATRPAATPTAGGGGAGGKVSIGRGRGKKEDKDGGCCK